MYMVVLYIHLRFLADNEVIVSLLSNYYTNNYFAAPVQWSTKNREAEQKHTGHGCESTTCL